MSYVPKYIMKRLVPAKAVKKVDDGIEIEVVNVLSPIPASDLPGNPLDEINLILNGAEMSKEDKQKIKVSIEGETLAFEDLRDAGTIAVGMKIIFFFPTSEFNSGDEATLKIEIPIVNMEIEVTRTIQ